MNRIISFFGQFNRNLWILALGWFVAALGFASSIPFISIYFHSTLGLSMTEIGVFFAVMAVVRSSFQIVGGELSDRVGRRGLLIHSQYVRTGTLIMLGVSIYYDWGFWPIAVFFTITSIAGGIFMPSINALVSDILPQSKRLDGYAVSRSAGNLGWAVGPAIGGFLAQHSYSTLFYISAGITLISALIFSFYLRLPKIVKIEERFRFRDLLAVRKDSNLARHCILTLMLYLVVSQLIAPMSVYVVDMVGLSESQLGMLFTVNGLLVVVMQIPVTRLLSRWRFTSQLGLGALLYFVGYSALGFFIGFEYFAMAVVLVTMGEVTMSPPALTLTSHLAPEGRMGRYMGVHGFFVTVGWSLGPLYGGLILDYIGSQPALAWLIISSLALISGVGYFLFGRVLPSKYNFKGETT